jgi:glycosyltransferase involved in cell wall biosynthesis
VTPATDPDPNQASGSERVFLHVLPLDLARGAQRYARYLVDRLDSPRDRHLIVTLFDAPSASLDPDIALSVRRGPLRDLGFDPRVVLRLRRVLRTTRPAAVVAHGGEPAKYLALAAARSVPIAYLSIGSAHPNLDRWLSRVLHRFYTTRADVVVAVSSDVAREAAELHGIPPDRIVVIPNGRDPAVFRPGASREGSTCRLLFVGHLDAGKRPELFVRLVAALRERGLHLEARMVGEGPLEDDIRPAADDAGVVMMGRRDDVPALLAESDILVLTSRPPEGMPGVLIEAGMSGVPVVSTRIPGSGDVVEEGLTGFLVDIDDFSALVDAVERLVVDRRLRSEMGRSARDHCVARFGMEATSQRWHEVLDELTASVAPTSDADERR